MVQTSFKDTSPTHSVEWKELKCASIHLDVAFPGMQVVASANPCVMWTDAGQFAAYLSSWQRVVRAWSTGRLGNDSMCSRLTKELLAACHSATAVCFLATEGMREADTLRCLLLRHNCLALYAVAVHDCLIGIRLQLAPCSPWQVLLRSGLQCAHEFVRQSQCAGLGAIALVTSSAIGPFQRKKPAVIRALAQRFRPAPSRMARSGRTESLDGGDLSVGLRGAHEDDDGDEASSVSSEGSTLAERLQTVATAVSSMMRSTAAKVQSEYQGRESSQGHRGRTAKGEGDASTTNSDAVSVIGDLVRALLMHCSVIKSVLPAPSADHCVKYVLDRCAVELVLFVIAVARACDTKDTSSIASATRQSVVAHLVEALEIAVTALCPLVTTTRSEPLDVLAWLAHLLKSSSIEDFHLALGDPVAGTRTAAKTLEAAHLVSICRVCFTPSRERDALQAAAAAVLSSRPCPIR